MQVQATGTTPITWTASNLPNGLSCSSAGIISGTPRVAYAGTVWIYAKNTAGSDSKGISLTIKDRSVIPPRITTMSLPDAYLGEPYNAKIEAEGTKPIYYEYNSAAISSGFLLDGSKLGCTTGIINGTPGFLNSKQTCFEPFTTTIRITASNSGGTDVREFKVNVKNPEAPTITTTSLSSGIVGQAYSVTLTATGTTPITWTASGLPGGLSCSTTGKISGTPTAAGTFSVTVTATNSAGSATKSLTLTVEDEDPNTSPEISVKVAPEFKNFSIMMEGTIGMNFYVYLPEIDSITYTDKNCWMDFNIRGDTSNVPQPLDKSYTRTINGIKCYRFRCYINAAQMADTITATLHYGNGLTVIKEYSAKTYLDTALNTPGFSQVIKDLMISIKNYGNYVQPMLSTQNGWTIGDKYLLMEAHSQITNTDISSAREAVKDYAFSKTINGAGIAALNYSLTFGAETTINIYITPASGYSGNIGAYLDDGTANMAVKLSDGRYRVRISDIAARELGDMHALEIHADKVSTAKISALSYVEAVLNSSAEKIGKVDIATMRKAVTALYQYHKAAKAYADTIK